MQNKLGNFSAINFWCAVFIKDASISKSAYKFEYRSVKIFACLHIAGRDQMGMIKLKDHRRHLLWIVALVLAL